MKKLILFVTAAAFSLCTTAQTLIYHTSFDNGQAQDLSGQGHHGTVNGATATTGFNGIASTALDFDGVNDNVVLPTDADFNLTTWTLQAMIRVDSYYSGTCQATSLIWHGNQFGNSCYALFSCDNFYETGNVCAQNTANEAFAAFAAGNATTPDFVTNYYTTNGHPTTGVWYCVTATYNGTTMNIYIDGTLVETGTWNGGAYNYTGNAPTYIGSSNGPTGSYPYWFNGKMDQVSIWSGVLNNNPPATDTNSIGGYCNRTRAGTWKQTNPKGIEEAIKSTNILQIADDRVEIFPIPATTQITVNVPAAWMGGKMVIMNGVGQTVMEQTVDGTQHEIDISELPLGIYMLKTMKGNQSKVEKFIKN